MFRILTLAMLTGLSGPVLAQDNIVVQSTTSTANSGLYDYLLPLARAATGVTSHVVAVGTGQAIKNARNCDGDLLVVHAKTDEETFVADGFGLARRNLMYNDFVIVGPEADPAGVSGLSDAQDALARIAAAGAVFTSRGDDSGTHKAELALWSGTGVDPRAASGAWYRETGSGMGATLNTAVGMDAYVLTDRASWASFGNRQDFRVLVEGDVDLFNQYGVIVVNPAKCPSVRAEAAQKVADWLVSDAGQSAIADFRIDGQQLFFPNAD